MSLFHNTVAIRRKLQPSRPIITLDGTREAQLAISSCRNYQVTPLRELAPLAETLGISRVYYKDEADRFGLESFKALGGAYAVGKMLQRKVSNKLGFAVSFEGLATGVYKHSTQSVTVIAATDGNHGRAVAAGASMFGCRSIIVLHAGVSKARELAIASRGAEIIRVQGNYDDSVREAARLAIQEGWKLIADTSSAGGEQACLDIMHGYTVLFAEALDQLEERNAEPLTHLFVQGGVGGLAAAACAYTWNSLGGEAPIVVVVEPERADCLFQSATAGEPRLSSGNLNTVMAGLACGEVSELAWTVLHEGAEFFMTIADSDAIAVMRLLADPKRVGVCIVAGESAGAGLAGLLSAMSDAETQRQLRLDSRSNVLVIGTEGATDPDIYQVLVGRPHTKSEL